MAEDNVLFVRRGKGSNVYDESTAGEEDIWDDTVLVKAYDKAVNLAKDEVARRMGLNKESASVQESSPSQKSSRKKKHGKREAPNWENGAQCCARYSGDGVWYEATIKAVMPETQCCVVKYVGYNNEEVLSLSELRASKGEAAIKKQELEAQLCQNSDLLQNGVDMECSEEDSGREAKSKSGAVHKPQHGSRMDCEFNSFPWLNNGFKPQAKPLRLPPMGVPPMMVAPPPPPHLTANFPDEDSEALSAMLMSWYMSGFHTGYYQGLKQGRNSQNGNNSSRSSSRK